MDNLLSAQVFFNSGNPYLFKVRDDVMLKDLKDQLNKINQGVIPEDARRVEDIWYAHPGYLQTKKIMLTDDDCVRNMFFQILPGTHVPEDWDESSVAEIT